MKRCLILFHVLIFVVASSQKKNNYKNILQSNSIEEIESFLKEAHPEDPRRMIMKSRLVHLKNTTWMKKGKDAPPPMASRPVVAEPGIVLPPKPSQEENEKKEFNELSALDSTDIGKKGKIRLLNELFSQDIHSEDAIVMVQNNSKCNIIMRIRGKESYDIPVSARSENSLALKKGDYQFTSSVCDIEYNSSKVVNKNYLITLNDSVSKKSNNDLNDNVPKKTKTKSKQRKK